MSAERIASFGEVTRILPAPQHQHMAVSNQARQPSGKMQFVNTSLVNRPYSRSQSLKPSLVFLNRTSYGRRRNNDVTSQEREVTMMLRHNLRTDAQICGKSANQASLFVRHGRGVNRVYCFIENMLVILVFVRAELEED